MPKQESALPVAAMPVVREVISSIVFDRETSTGTVTRRDGVSATMELSSPMFEPSSGIARVTYLPADDLVRFVTVRGDEVTAEVPTVEDMAPLRSRPVVYLDQKDWSLLANSVHETSRVADEDLQAARTLIELVETGRVVLPMSAAHMNETCKWTNPDRRYRLALTITAHSRGWQMRSPLATRIDELRRSLLATKRGTDPGSVEVFTLEPDALHPPDAAVGSRRFGRDFPPDLAHALRALTSVSATFDTMLDAEPVIPGAIPGWVERQQQFSATLAKQAGSRSERDRMVDAFFLVDAVPELEAVLAAEGIPADEASGWLERLRDIDVESMPSMGLFREVLRGKHLNRGTTWESNDLTDMIYLCCAAGYADHVVGERSMIAQIEQAAARLGRTGACTDASATSSKCFPGREYGSGCSRDLRLGRRYRRLWVTSRPVRCAHAVAYGTVPARVKQP